MTAVLCAFTSFISNQNTIQCYDRFLHHCPYFPEAWLRNLILQRWEQNLLPKSKKPPQQSLCNKIMWNHMTATILSSPHIQVKELTSSLESNMQFGALGLSVKRIYNYSFQNGTASKRKMKSSSSFHSEPKSCWIWWLGRVGKRKLSLDPIILKKHLSSAAKIMSKYCDHIWHNKGLYLHLFVW